jgi:nucleoside-diphosphate-sugar epimerase
MESTLSRFKDLKSNSLSDNEKSFAILKDRLYKLMKSLGMPFHWVRPHYLFGPKQHENSLLNSTIRNLKLEANWLKTPYAKNDYVYIKDLAKLVDRVVHGNLAVPEVFDFGSGKYTSNLDFVNTLRRYLGYEEYRLPKKKGYVNSLSDNKPWQELLPNFKITTLEDAFRDMNLKNL